MPSENIKSFDLIKNEFLRAKDVMYYCKVVSKLKTVFPF